VKFTKCFLSYEDQAAQLLDRGLLGDKATLIGHLQAVNYYRLSGYWYPFREADPGDPKSKLDTFYTDATVTKVWNRYVFDRRLRLLVMDAIERIEVDARTRLAYLHAERHGPFGYADDPASLPGLSGQDHASFRAQLREDYRRSREDFVEHFRTKYGADHADLPIWVACELMTFGSVLTFYRGCEAGVQKELARRYGVSDTVCLSWMRTLNTIRNICAHHARLWNRVLGVKPLIPNKDRRWNHPATIPNDRVFGVLTICRYCLAVIAPGSDWTDRFKQLLAEYPDVPHQGLGLIPGWDRHLAWL
jgi:abortive infection bacteriophage resistance protein